MGMFEKIFKKQSEKVQYSQHFQTLNGYTPVFSSHDGGLYEMALTRSAIHSVANNFSKLNPKVTGQSYKSIESVLRYRPNEFMTTQQFLYKVMTILLCENNVFIVPIKDDYTNRIVGIYPISPSSCELKEYQKELYVVFNFYNGQRTALPYREIGHMKNHYYKDDIFGESNKAFKPVIDLLHTQNEGIINGVKQSANIRFLAKLTNVFKSTDIEKERQRFTEDNLNAKNNGGVMIFDNKYEDVKVVDSKPFVVNAEQQREIEENVFSYFGTNKKIIQNNYTEDEWNAFYEGQIEPYAIQLSQILTNMFYSKHELSFGNEIILEANRLQYASNVTKLSIVTQMFDRGFLTHNQGLEIFNMAPVDNGDKYFIRREYVEIDKIGQEEKIQNEVIANDQEGITNSSN